MKVVHLSTARTWRGGEQQVMYLAEELKKLGIQQIVICAAESEMARRCKKKGIPFKAIKKHSGFDLAFSWKVKKAAMEFGATLLHMHDAHAHTAAIIATDLFQMKLPLILSRRVDFRVSNTFISKYKYNHRAIKRIVCVSDAIRQITAESIRNKSIMTVVHSGVNTERFSLASNEKRLHKEFNLNEDISIVGNTSALAKHKDYPTFIRTAAKVIAGNNKVVFFIVGNGPEMSSIKAMVQSEGLSNKVLFTDFRADIPVILKEFNVFLMPSETEGLGTSLLDAMACGVPIVSTRAGGIPEIVEHDHNGLLSEVGDSDNLSKQVLEILSNQELGERLRQSAFLKVREFSSENMAKKTLKIYHEI